jgi:hypothetical protein
MSQGVAKGGSGTAIVWVVLASGALFGVAAQALLGHFGLDPSSIRADLATGQAAPFRLALAWWAWWIVAMLALHVGRLSAALTRFLIANRRLIRDLWLLLSAGVVLGAVGQLPAARPDLGGTTDAAMSLGILALAAALAALGARSGPARRRTGAPAMRTWASRSRVLSPFGSLSPVLHDGSVNAGLPSPGMRHRRSLAGASTGFGRRTLAATAIGIAVAAVSALGAAAVVLQQMPPQAVRETVASKRAVTGSVRSSTETRPARSGETVGAARDRSVPLPLPPVRQPTAVAGAFAMATPDESELTFAKGYARRRAVLDAAGITAARPPTKPVTKVTRERGAAPPADRRNNLGHDRSYDFQRTFGGG